MAKKKRLYQQNTPREQAELEKKDLERVKLKHSNDYSGKRVESSKRFQDKAKSKSHRRGLHNQEDTSKTKRRKRQNKSFESEAKEAVIDNSENDVSKQQIKASQVETDNQVEVDDKSSEKGLVAAKTSSSTAISNSDNVINNQKALKQRQKDRIRKEQAALNQKKVKMEETSKSEAFVNVDEYKVEKYDPLEKDLDNDGIIDRYDHDFRDSDYEESTFDVDGLKKDEVKEVRPQTKSQKKNKHQYQYHRNKDKANNSPKMKDIKVEADSDKFSNDPKIKTYKRKQAQKIRKLEKEAGKKSKTPVLSLYATTTEAAKTYLRNSSDDNTGVESGEKVLDAQSKLVNGIKDYRAKRNKKQYSTTSHLNKKIQKRQSKLEFRELKSELKKSDEYQKMSAYKKFQKRKQMKAAIYKKNKLPLKERIKNALLVIGKKSKEFIKKRGLRLGIMFFGLFLFLSVIMQSCSLLGGLNGGSSMIASSSYMTSDHEITVSDELLGELEVDLLIEIQNIPTTHPGYDRYDYQVDSIGHDPQTLIAYLTAKYGEYSFSEVESEIHQLFAEMYSLELEEKTETYIEIVETEVVDEETGEVTIEEEEVEKTRRILITKLRSKRIEDILIGKLNEEQQEHFEVLQESKGNFMNLNSPIPTDWKVKVSSMYGYRADPFTSEKKFHTGIDIADSEGTPLLALFDGTVTKVSFDEEGYGHYVELTDKEGNMARYAHASSITSSVGQVIKQGNEVAKMGTTGRSTGSHLHLELHLSDGTRVNPYFYLYSESEFNGYTRPSVSSFYSFNWQGSDTAETVWGYLVTNGYTPQAAAGIMGNIEAESGFNTSAVESSATNPGEGIGLIQWSFGRKAQLLSFAQSQGKHWSDIGVQIAFLDYEMNGAEGTVFPGGVNGFKNLTSIEEATSQFCWLFERPNALYAHYDRRSSAAHAFYEMYKDFDASVVKP